MQVQNPNNVKIYYLSAGKSLPEWLSERKRRALLKKNVDIRRRIELIQDFDMPAVSSTIQMSRDGESLIATGIYKPRVKCFDVNNLSLKFERCFDSEVVAFNILSDDYSKMVFLQCDRHIEFHNAQGKLFRLRIPRFGRDMQYHYPSCDLFIVGTSKDIYRLNLERGQFLQPFESDSFAINKCTINPVHHLLLCGSENGTVQAWDPRVRNKVGTLDCAFHCISQDTELKAIPSITALKCNKSLTLGVGTANGNVLIYDIRSNKPLIVKDHMYDLPIKAIDYHDDMDLIYSMDGSIVKIWEKNTGKLYTSIEGKNEFNDLCVAPNTGMLFMANEAPKMQTYYIPSLGPAPKWCSFLDNLTEELEEQDYEDIYDDYKFVTDKELDELGLSHLRGTNLLRAYMHGYFMDMRLYRKARDVMKPFSFEEYKKMKIRQQVKEERKTNTVKVHKLPTINQDLALKHIEMESDPKSKKKNQPNLLKDDRFKALFSNPDFQIDTNTEEYALLNPVISQTLKRKRGQQAEEVSRTEIENHSDEERNSADEDFRDSSSSEDEKEMKERMKEVSRNYRKVKQNERDKDRAEQQDKEEQEKKKLEFYEIKEGIKFRGNDQFGRKRMRISLGDRLKTEEGSTIRQSGSRGNKEMTFSTVKQHRKRREESSRSRSDFKQQLRPANRLGKR